VSPTKPCCDNDCLECWLSYPAKRRPILPEHERAFSPSDFSQSGTSGMGQVCLCASDSSHRHLQSSTTDWHYIMGPLSRGMSLSLRIQSGKDRTYARSMLLMVPHCNEVVESCRLRQGDDLCCRYVSNYCNSDSGGERCCAANSLLTSK